MKRITFKTFLFFSLIVNHAAATQSTVDVCFMVADLKYNTRQGVKICEVQQGSLSLFNGNSYRSKEEKSIYSELLRTLTFYNKNGWVVANSIADKNVVTTLANSSSWWVKSDIMSLVSDQNFMHQAQKEASDPYNLASYQGFLYINWTNLSAIYDFEKRFPGMIVIDKSSFPFWIDKYEMTKIFAQDETLATFKPRWGIYKKNYHKELAAHITADLKGEIFVIKPRGEFLGKGVIIVERQNLDEVLSYIINKEGSLAHSTDPAYTAWKHDPFDDFIVEEFVTSDLISIPHLGNKIYQPTMRVAFLLIYQNGCHDVHFLGHYWKTPPCSYNEEGSFMEKNKDICKPPYYCAVDTKTQQFVEKELRIALPILHHYMVKTRLDAHNISCFHAKKKLQIEVVPL